MAEKRNTHTQQLYQTHKAMLQMHLFIHNQTNESVLYQTETLILHFQRDNSNECKIKDMNIYPVTEGTHTELILHDIKSVIFASVMN